MGWKVCLWSRLKDGNHAYKLIEKQISLVPDTTESGSPGGTYPNMLDAHPPFQIDGNFGCTAGIAEMLVQSHDGFIELLPALPDDWNEGEVCGLRTVGGFLIEKMKWTNGHLQVVVIKSLIGGNLRLKANSRVNLENCGLSHATLTNPNPLFAVYTMPVQISKNGFYENIPLRLESYENLYDISTVPNQQIVIKNKD